MTVARPLCNAHARRDRVKTAEMEPVRRIHLFHEASRDGQVYDGAGAEGEAQILFALEART
jgi:hypothetical protein